MKRLSLFFANLLKTLHTGIRQVNFSIDNRTLDIIYLRRLVKKQFNGLIDWLVDWIKIAVL